MILFWFLSILHVAIGQNLQIPYTFSIGVASSAYPSEGAWDQDGKGPSVWDTLVHAHPELISNQSNGDVACDSYHFYKEDVANAANMACQHYRFSISWSRLLPYGTPEFINPWAVDYYYSLMREIQRNQMEPYVVMYHWDLPQRLQDIGGWLNPDIVDHFVNYARVLIELFGHSAAYWITIDDPQTACVSTYDLNQNAPLVEPSPGLGCYLCAKHMLLAHAKVYRMRREDFATRNCAIGLGITSIWAEPKSNTSQEDIDAADREMQMTLRWFADPLVLGDYPDLMKSRIEYLSGVEGFIESRLPLLTDQEIAVVKGAFGFLAINHFHSYLVTPSNTLETDPPSFEKDKGTIRESGSDWGVLGYPEGLRKLLNYIKFEYDNPRVFLTIGYGDENADLEDETRLAYVKQYVRQAVMALNQDACEVDFFTIWSLMDQMEWRSGYKTKYGLYYVDFNDPQRSRTRRISGAQYRAIAALRVVGE